MFHLCFVDHFFQRMGKVGHNDNRDCAAVVKLMLQLARGVQRVNVDDNHPGTQDTEQRHRVLQQVRHHQRDAIPFCSPSPSCRYAANARLRSSSLRNVITSPIFTNAGWSA